MSPAGAASIGGRTAITDLVAGMLIAPAPAAFGRNTGRGASTRRPLPPGPGRGHPAMQPQRPCSRSSATAPRSTTASMTSPVRDWLPVLADALRAKPPRHIPRWLTRLIAGEAAVDIGTQARGTSNAKAKRELGWTLRYPAGGNASAPPTFTDQPVFSAAVTLSSLPIRAIAAPAPVWLPAHRWR